MNANIKFNFFKKGYTCKLLKFETLFHLNWYFKRKKSLKHERFKSHFTNVYRTPSANSTCKQTQHWKVYRFKSCKQNVIILLTHIFFLYQTISDNNHEASTVVINIYSDLDEQSTSTTKTVYLLFNLVTCSYI